MDEQELLREQAALLEGAEAKRRAMPPPSTSSSTTSSPLGAGHHQLGWRQVPAGREMQRDELVHYAQTRRDALQAMVQG